MSAKRRRTAGPPHSLGRKDNGQRPVKALRTRSRDRKSAPTYQISGRVIDKQTGGGVSGVRVEAWDKDVKFHSLLGRTEVDSEGHFRIEFDESYFGDYGGDRQPDLFFKVFRDTELVASTEGAVRRNVTPGEVSSVIELESPTPLPAPRSAEVGLHEVGESIAASLVMVQRELARYPNTLGAYILDEVDLNIPMHLRTDSLGQIMATVANGDPGNTTAQVHLRVRPILGATQPRPTGAQQPLRALGTLSPQTITQLHAKRIFSVEDLQRVGRNAAGLAALEKLGLGVPVRQVLGRAEVLGLPVVPAAVAEALLQSNVFTPDAFVDANPEKLASTLSQKVGQPISEQDVKLWQRDVQNMTALSLPTRPAVPDVMQPTQPIDGPVVVSDPIRRSGIEHVPNYPKESILARKKGKSR